MATYTAADLARKLRQTQEVVPSTYLLYGPPKVGKTQLAATVAKIPAIKRVWFFNMENGFDTVLAAQEEDGSFSFTEEDLSKITVLQIEDTTRAACFTITEDMEGVSPDMRQLADSLKGGIPRAADTCMRMIAGAKPRHYWDMEQCKIVSKENENTVLFDWAELGPQDAVVLDTGTQLSASLFSYVQLFNPRTKEPRQWYNAFYGAADALLSRIQTAKCTVIMTCHAQFLEEDKKKGRNSSKVVPVFGSKNYSWQVSRYFGTQVYLDIEMKQHMGISKPTTRSVIQAGSRRNVDVQGMQTIYMADLMGLTERSRKQGASQGTVTSTASKPMSKPTSGTTKPVVRPVIQTRK